MSAPTARLLIELRRTAIRRRLVGHERRLSSVRVARAEWTDEEHDPEGFALTNEWSQAEGSRLDDEAELRALVAAEARVADGIYGICDRCGAGIPLGQLERRPARTNCVACGMSRG
jgi:DnaK suppressor protein